jgi:uncharacterized protein
MTTWDNAKSRANLAKHGVSLDLAQRFDLGGAMIEEDRDIDHEQRFRAIGFVGDKLYFLVFTLDGRGEMHVISMRPATPKERRKYAEGK